ncbi:hypothetical protein GC167_08915 [bacterium]|nr:hypothetical protein [bacterium]
MIQRGLQARDHRLLIKIHTEQTIIKIKDLIALLDNGIKECDNPEREIVPKIPTINFDFEVIQSLGWTHLFNAVTYQKKIRMKHFGNSTQTI